MAAVAVLAQEAETTTDPDRLAELAKHRSARVRMQVVGNPATRDDTMKALLADDRVSNVVAAQLAGRPALQEHAAASPHWWIRASVAATYRDDDERTLSRGVQERLARDDSTEVRRVIAQTTQYLPIFEALLRDADPIVRGCCAGNPRITAEQMWTLTHDRIARTRAIAVAMGLRYPTDDELVELAHDRSVQVHWEIICRVDAPREALEVIAATADDVNRHHAQIILDGGYVNAPQVQEQTRAGRQRAGRGVEFIS